MSFRTFCFSLIGVLFLFTGISNAITIVSDDEGYITDLQLVNNTWPANEEVTIASHGDWDDPVLFFESDSLNNIDAFTVMDGVTIRVLNDVQLKFTDIVVFMQGSPINRITWQSEAQDSTWRGLCFDGEVSDIVVEDDDSWMMQYFDIQDVDGTDHAALLFDNLLTDSNLQGYQEIEIHQATITGLGEQEHDFHGIDLDTREFKFNIEGLAISDCHDAIRIQPTFEPYTPTEIYHFNYMILRDCNYGINYGDPTEEQNIGMRNLEVRGSQILNIANDGIRVDEYYELGNLKLLATRIDTCDGNGLEIEGGSFTVKLDSSKIEHCDYGIHITGDNTDLILESQASKLNNNTYDGIYCTGNDFNLLSFVTNERHEVQFNQNNGIFIENFGAEITLNNVDFDTNSHDGMHIESEKFKIALKNVSCTGNESNGVFLANGPEPRGEVANKIFIQGGSYNYNGLNGFEVTSVHQPINPDFTELEFYSGGTNNMDTTQFNYNGVNTPSHGLHVHNGADTLNDCVDGKYFFGVAVTDTGGGKGAVDFVSINGPCTFNGNTVDGFYFQGAKNEALINGCKFSYNLRDGIHVQRETATGYDEGNTINDFGSYVEENFRNGVYIERRQEGDDEDINSTNMGGTHIIKNCDSHQNPGTQNLAGVLIDDLGTHGPESHQFSSCVIDTNGLNRNDDHPVQGMMISSSDDIIMITGCYIRSNSDQGIASDSMADDNILEISECTVCANFKEGIQLESLNFHRVSIEKNYIEGNYLEGIDYAVDNLAQMQNSKIHWNIVRNNNASDTTDVEEGAGVHIRPYNQWSNGISLTHNLINNGNAGLVWTAGGTASINNNIIHMDTTDTCKYAMLISPESNAPVVKHNTIIKESGDSAAVLISIPGAAMNFDLNIVIDTSATCIGATGSVNANNCVVSPTSGFPTYYGINATNVQIAEPKLYPYSIDTTDGDNISDPYFDEILLRYHLMWDSPAINADTVAAHADDEDYADPRAKPYAHFYCSPADAGAFGGPEAKDWPIPHSGWHYPQPPVDIRDLFNYEIYYRDYSVAPIAERCDTLDLDDDTTTVIDDVSLFKDDTYFVITRLVLDDTMGVIPPGCVFLYGYNERSRGSSPYEFAPDPAGLTINRRVDIVGANEYRVVMDSVRYPWDLYDYQDNIGENPDAIFNRTWQGIYITDQPPFNSDPQSIDYYHNLAYLTILKANTGITCKSLITKGDSLIFDACRVGVRLDNEGPPGYLPSQVRLDNSHYIDIIDTCVVLGHGYPQYRNDNTSMGTVDDNPLVGVGTMNAGIENPAEYYAGIFKSVNSRYRYFTDKAIHLINVRFYMEDDLVEGADSIGVLFQHQFGGYTPSIKDCEIRDCGIDGLEADTDSTTYYAGLVLEDCKMSVLGTNINNCAAACVAIMDYSHQTSAPVFDKGKAPDYYLNAFNSDLIEVYNPYAVGDQEFGLPNHYDKATLFWIGTFSFPKISNSRFYEPDTTGDFYYVSTAPFDTSMHVAIEVQGNYFYEASADSQFGGGWNRTRAEWVDLPHDVQLIGPGTIRTIAESYEDDFIIAMRHFRNGDYDDALDYFEEYIEDNSESGTAVAAAEMAVQSAFFEDGEMTARELLSEYREDYEETAINRGLMLWAPNLHLLADSVLGAQEAFDEYTGVARRVGRIDSIRCELQKIYLEPGLPNRGRRTQSYFADRNDRYRKLKEQLKKLKGKEQDDAIVALPQKFELYDPYPNPFNSTTRIRFDVPKTGKVEILVYNILGRQVASLVDSRIKAGKHTVLFKHNDLASGLYLVRMKSARFERVRKMVLLK
ncbi:MAG: T9SS type A sorting domain-containing protein [Candidatus Electryonea clarkiae]|nr:T9SS type A sorting domain-containing protein [Candidatus Electryonea clarkiae]MDP8287584.1 T9SS type A sorting domain-containing protein [Candidatus Electryonea clarkiae]